MKAAQIVLAVVLAAALAVPAEAASSRKGKRLQSSPAAAPAQSGNPMARNGYSGYYERIEDRVPFGSKVWWDVYNSMPRG